MKKNEKNSAYDNFSANLYMDEEFFGYILFRNR